MCKFAISVFLYSLLIGLFGGQLVSADEFELNEVESLPDFSDIANPLSKISAISVKQSSVFSSQELVSSVFDLIGRPATQDNISEMKKNIVALYTSNHHFSPDVVIKKDSIHPNVYQAIIIEPVLLSFDVVGGDNETRSRAIPFLNALIGGSIINEDAFRYLENALEGRLGIGAKIEYSAFNKNKKRKGFHIVVKLVGSVNTTISISNEGTETLGKEVVFARVQLVDKIPGFKSIYFSTFNTLKTDGYRSLGAGFVSGLTKKNELYFNMNLSRAQYDIIGDSSIPNIVYDRQLITLGWQYQISEKRSFSNTFFAAITASDLERKQYVDDIDEKLRAVELGYWQQNVWKDNALFWQGKVEKGLDSLGAKLEGPLADTNTDIDYSLFTLQMVFNKDLFWDIGLRTDIQGQYSSDFLPSSQRFSIASNSLIRAFEGGEINGDSGLGIKIELSKGDDLALLSSRVVPYSYYSIGKVRDNAAIQSTTAASIGLGVRWFNRFLSSYVELGKPLEEDSRYRESSPRIRASVRLFF